MWRIKSPCFWVYQSILKIELKMKCLDGGWERVDSIKNLFKMVPKNYNKILAKDQMILFPTSGQLNI